jgi:hypothetical protein
VNALNEILDAMHHLQLSRSAAPDHAARLRICRQFQSAQNARQAALARAFGHRNGWRLTTRFSPYDLSGRRRECEWHFDHALYYRDARTRAKAALVMQPYDNADLGPLQATLAPLGLHCHVPPNAFASFWYPGWTVFIVVTKPDVVVHWLPEQLTFGKGKDAA